MTWQNCTGKGGADEAHHGNHLVLFNWQLKDPDPSKGADVKIPKGNEFCSQSGGFGAMASGLRVTAFSRDSILQEPSFAYDPLKL